MNLRSGVIIIIIIIIIHDYYYYYFESLLLWRRHDLRLSQERMQAAGRTM